MTVGCASTILVLIEAKALRLGRNKNNIAMCNRSSLILMSNFWNGTDGTATFHFNLVRRVFSFSNNEKTLETSAKPCDYRNVQASGFGQEPITLICLIYVIQSIFGIFSYVNAQIGELGEVNPPRSQSDEKVNRWIAYTFASNCAATV